MSATSLSPSRRSLCAIAATAGAVSLLPGGLAELRAAFKSLRSSQNG